MHPIPDPNLPATVLPPASVAADTTADLTVSYQPAPDTEPHLPGSPPADLLAIPGYEITGEIARGGMGRVLAGRELALDREVAIKVLLPGANATRFVTESKITAKLPHPAIPPVYALGTLANGSPFLAMKRIVGRTLAEELATRPDAAHDRARFVAVLARVCEAVAYAHARGVIHRDLKPLNVMVGEFGEVQVMDWGLAKELGEASLAKEAASAASVGLAADPNVTTAVPEDMAAEQTRAGSVMGTPGYMPPEQARGDIAAVDRRADVFALGAMLCEVLTGLPPYGRESTAVVLARATAGVLGPAFEQLDGCGAEAELVSLCKRCLSADPVARPADAGAVATALADYQSAAEERARRAEVELGRADERRKRRRVLWGLATTAVLLTVAIGFGAVVTSLWRKAERATVAADMSRLDAERERDRVARFEYGRAVLASQQSWNDNEVAEAVRILGDTEPKYRGWEWEYLRRQFNQHALEFDECSFAALSHDGRRCASWQWPTINVWDVTTGEKLLAVHQQIGNDGGVGQFSADGKWLATNWNTSLTPFSSDWPKRDGAGITVWNVDARKALLEIPVKELKDFVLSADGDKLVVATEHAVEIWHVATGKQTAKWNCPTLKLHRVGCNRDASRVLTDQTRPTSYESIWTLWNPADPSRPLPLTVNGKEVRSASFSDDGKTLMTATFDEAHLRNGLTGEVRSTFRPPQKGLFFAVDIAAVSPDGRSAAVATDSDIRVWNVLAGKWSAVLPGPAAVRELTFTASGNRLIASYADCSVRVWDTANSKQLRLIRGLTRPCRRLDASRDGDTLLTSTDAELSNRGPVRVWNLQNLSENGFTSSHREPTPLFSFEWEGRRFLFGEEFGGKAWGLNSLDGQHPLPKGQEVVCATASPDGQRAAIAFADRRMLLTDRQNNRKVVTLDAEWDSHLPLTFSPDGTKLFGGSVHSKLHEVVTSWGIIWDAVTGAEIARLKGSPFIIRSAAFSPDGKWLTTGTDDGTVRSWDAITGEQRWEQIGDGQERIGLIHFDPSGSRVAVATSRHAVALRDVATGHQLARFNGHTGEVTSIAFHPTEDRMATGSKDGSVRVWDTVSGAEVLKLREPNGRSAGVLVEFSKDSHQLLVSTDGETFRNYDTASNRLPVALK